MEKKLEEELELESWSWSWRVGVGVGGEGRGGVGGEELERWLGSWLVVGRWLGGGVGIGKKPFSCGDDFDDKAV